MLLIVSIPFFVSAQKNSNPDNKKNPKIAKNQKSADNSLTEVISWDNVRERKWAGPDFWCNRLQDWVVKDDYLRAETIGDEPCRTAHLLTWSLTEKRGPFTLQTKIRMEGYLAAGSFTGFLIGAGAGMLDYRGASLIHHFPGKGGGILAVLDTEKEPKLSFRDMSANTNKAEYPLLDRQKSDVKNPIVLNKEFVLILEGTPGKKGKYDLKLVLKDADNEEILAINEINHLDERLLIGNIALVSHAAASPIVHMFGNLAIGGERIQNFPNRTFGPVVGTLYSVSDDVLKLSAQFVHLGYETFLLEKFNKDVDYYDFSLRKKRKCYVASLEKKLEDGNWETISGPLSIVGPHYNVLFRIENWDSNKAIELRVVFRDFDETEYYYTTHVTANPVEKPVLSVAGFTGMGAIGRSPYLTGPKQEEGEVVIGRWSPANVWTPFAQTIEAVKKQDVDLLFFTGDQVYENKPSPKDWTINPAEDYLYKWFVWLWSFRELTNHLPTIVQPDDHDVYHGNLWGWSGKLNTTGDFDDGGYERSPFFVNLVHRTQSVHLPDAWCQGDALNEITNYYTRFNWGGVGFAVLEDRKYKTPPQIEDPGEQLLLGAGQMNMLEDWQYDWKDQQFKCVVSQTVYASMHTDWNGKIFADKDSNGFPKVRRDEFLNIVRSYGAFILSGDQHLGTFARLGIEQPSDAVYQFAVPALGNYFWRWFYPEDAGNDREPGAPNQTGEFIDGFGNYFRIIAVANPEERSLMDQKLRQRYMITKEEAENGLGDTKRTCLGDGYGITRFDKEKRTITVENWPHDADPTSDSQFEEWPVTIQYEALDGRKPVAWLPELKIKGGDNAVVLIIDEQKNEVVKSTRISGNSYYPPVFKNNGTFKVKVGIPEKDVWWEIEGLTPTVERGKSSIEVVLLLLE